MPSFTLSQSGQALKGGSYFISGPVSLRSPKARRALGSRHSPRVRIVDRVMAGAMVRQFASRIAIRNCQRLAAASVGRTVVVRTLSSSGADTISSSPRSSPTFRFPSSPHLLIQMSPALSFVHGATRIPCEHGSWILATCRKIFGGACVLTRNDAARNQQTFPVSKPCKENGGWL
ncbi:hypothetical protein Micbo1qcDRAFT_162420 [Microdochium bolleyi]|uniref:Uncharacterized protein n=1 Tax=Microdochium bolleyi TaxID=196109 RepID=A0A136J513_9PEZI|nr:hypothetical protein Micbo1qcDRAFT_162420 [Microdochium bolleyi]